MLTAASAYAQTAPISTSKATGGSKPRPSAPTSGPAPAAGSAPTRSTKPTRRCTAPGCSRTSTSARSGGRIVVTVVENPVINRIQFEGNRRVKDEQLKPEIQSKERGTLSRGVVQSDVQRIVEVYRRSGRYDVTVVPKIIDLPNGRVDLVFEITEGDKTTILGIEFVGNRAYSSWRLKDVVRTTQTNILSFLQSTNIYDQDRLEADRELLRRFYLKNGYIDVRIVACRRRIRSGAATVSSSPSRSRRASSIAWGRSTSARTSAPSIPG